MRIYYRRRAQLDIANIRTYIAERNPQAATAVVARIRSAVDRLAQWPHLGHAGRIPGTLEWAVVSLRYVIVYTIDEGAGELSVIAVFHGAQQRG